MKIGKVLFFIAFAIICYSNFVYARGGGGRGGGGGSNGTVTFRIAHAHRTWIWGNAKHWDPSGRLSETGFRHRGGYEYAYFGSKPIGSSRGFAQVTVGACSCSDYRSYYVNRGGNTIDFNMR